ncbi:thiol reductant ABC exporter subunit CydD [Ectobacillus sp. JY-23]|uniref:thiol reductant ABC exporter subunit CydD n=1 Tax=Ectobacillus sp. JY-23 TaxID=2933872 RepID=UPI001FF11555|nr:thiol reductant ABC exporter subunit CydD [Ectobacillus sp. JY-23]UOY92440.1 thiol reductant ABC exporter subunit CydD [Ectobacillus sp. JY-23]
MKHLQAFARRQKALYYTLFALAIGMGGAIIAQAYFIVSVVDKLFLQKQDFAAVVPMLGALLLALLLRTFFSYSTNRIGIRMAALAKNDYRKRLLEAVSDQSLLSSYEGQSGQKVSLLLDTVDELDSFFSKYMPQRMVSSVVAVMIIIALFTQHYISALIVLATAPFIPMFMAIIGRSTQQKAEEKLANLNAFSGRFLDTLQGLVSLRLYGRSGHYKELIRTSSIQFRDSTMSILKIAFTSAFMLEFISMLSIGLVALELCLRLVVFKSIDFFPAFFILLLVPEFYQLLKDLGSAFHAGRSSSGAAAKVEEGLLVQEAKAWGDAPLAKGPVHITLRNVSFSYSDNMILQDINTVLPSVGQVALVGKSGAGKTTLLHIIAGLLETEGVTVNGKDRFAYKEQDWLCQISYITQQPYLFAGTIAENIALGLDVTRADIEEAAQKANIASMIRSLPDGYDTVIGEGGRGLSGGEKQRIAIARAFLRKSSVVLLDEPTSGLDIKTEHVLQEAIAALAETALVVTVAHRLPTIRRADKVLFIHNGTIAAEGTHEELYETEAYQALFTRQGGGTDERATADCAYDAPGKTG